MEDDHAKHIDSLHEVLAQTFRAATKNRMSAQTAEQIWISSVGSSSGHWVYPISVIGEKYAVSPQIVENVTGYEIPAVKCWLTGPYPPLSKFDEPHVSFHMCIGNDHMLATVNYMCIELCSSGEMWNFGLHTK